MRDGPQDCVVQPFGEGHRPLRVTGGAEIPPLAGEREQVLVAALVAANTGETLPQVATYEIFSDDISNNRAKVSVGVGVFLRINSLKLFKMPGDKTEEGRFAGISRMPAPKADCDINSCVISLRQQSLLR